MKNKIPKLFKGGISTDKRGRVSFNNNLTLKKIKRFYLVENFKKTLLEPGMVIKWRKSLFYVSRVKLKSLLLK